MASHSRVLYTGVTGAIERRTSQHRFGLLPGFTSKYKVHRLVYVEEFSEINAAIRREKQIKNLVRRKKIALIEASNPEWDDLGETL